MTLAPDAMERAREAEAAILRGEIRGPLHGVPLTVKDTIETAGLRTTAARQCAPISFPIATRLRYSPESSGRDHLGKTNTAEMAMDYTADNPVFGRAGNPYNPALTPGGSSGGEAAAIATCMSAGGIGSDLAGSVRIPAHFCGIAALKPTVGRVPGEGQFPAATGPYALGSVIGPMARTVGDVQLLYGVLAGIEAFTSPSLRGVRLAVYSDDKTASVTEETAAQLKRRLVS